MMKKIVVLMGLAFLLLPFSAEAIDADGRFSIGFGGSFPMEKLSVDADIGYGLDVGYERVLSDHISILGKWGYTNNSLRESSDAVTVNAAAATFKYYFQPLEFAPIKTAVIPYILFSGGVTVVDNQVEEVDPFTVVGSAFGLGINWQAFKNLDIFGEVKLDIVDRTKRVMLSGGLVFPFDAI